MRGSICIEKHLGLPYDPVLCLIFFVKASQPQKICTKYVEPSTKWPKVLKLYPPPPPQMAHLSLCISRLTENMTLLFHLWMVIDINNTMPQMNV